MANAFFNCPDPKEQPEFLYRRGSLVKISENCMAADSTEVKLVSFVARRVAKNINEKRVFPDVGRLPTSPSTLS